MAATIWDTLKSAARCWIITEYQWGQQRKSLNWWIICNSQFPFQHLLLAPLLFCFCGFCAPVVRILHANSRQLKVKHRKKICDWKKILKVGENIMFCFIFAFEPCGQCRDTSSAAAFVLDISMIHAWCDAWPEGLQNLYWDQARLHSCAWPESIIMPVHFVWTDNGQS